ncbi:opacity protein-like surface antigen [Caballeronia udeis]|uniref:Opacity protein-like surface antigen n=1 Tax=Caballeronia udeis TaxID=1232866 RepID=A0ABW8MYH3_9BURK
MRPTVRILGKLALMLIATLAGSAAQANDAITAVNNEIGLSIGSQNIAYHESNGAPSWLPTGPDGYMDSEIGSMPSYALTYSRQGSLFGLSNVYTQLNATVTAGQIEYTSGSIVTMTMKCSGLPGTSSTSYCSEEPVQSSFAQNHSSYEIDLSGRLGRAFEVSKKAQVTPYVSLGGHYWLRHAPGAGEDTYTNGYAGIGALTQYALTPRLVVGLDAGVAETFGAASFESNVRYPLGSRPMIAASLGVDYAVSKRWHVTAAYAMAHWRYGASNFQSSHTYEPADWTTTQTVSIGIAYSYR